LRYAHTRHLDGLLSAEDDPTIRYQGHGLSTTTLIRGREETLYNSSLCVASLRIELRQEVTISFMTRKPISILARDCSIDIGLGPSDDWTWTYRIIACLADCLNLCYRPKHDSFTEAYGELSQYLDDWTQHCPPTFKPIGSMRADKTKNETLPKIWFLDDCHGMYCTIPRRNIFANFDSGGTSTPGSLSNPASRP
jgi:hypothetical protein